MKSFDQNSKLLPFFWNFDLIFFPAVFEMCDEPMGLENGEFTDDQVQVSSVLGDQPFYGKKNARLNYRGQPYLAAGAWVAEPEEKSYIRVR